MIGFGLCMCSFGFSMIPVVCCSKRTRLKLKKLIEMENHRIYRKIGLEWKLGNRFMFKVLAFVNSIKLNFESALSFFEN